MSEVEVGVALPVAVVALVAKVALGVGVMDVREQRMRHLNAN